MPDTDVSDLTPCTCGKLFYPTRKNITHTYNQRKIRIIAVPIFICGSGHTNVDKHVRERIMLDVRMAYDEGLNESYYGV